eukprot:3124934-Amphidinium_carterae.2
MLSWHLSALQPALPLVDERCRSQCFTACAHTHTKQHKVQNSSKSAHHLDLPTPLQQSYIFSAGVTALVTACFAMSQWRRHAPDHSNDGVEHSLYVKLRFLARCALLALTGDALASRVK